MRSRLHKLCKPGSHVKVKKTSVFLRNCYNIRGAQYGETKEPPNQRPAPAPAAPSTFVSLEPSIPDTSSVKWVPGKWNRCVSRKALSFVILPH